MPTYVYQCKSCDKIFELEQRIIEDALTACLCEKKGAVKRIIQPVGIAFKGSGFYVNDGTSAVNPTLNSEPVAETIEPIPAPDAPSAPASETPVAPSVATDSTSE